MILEERLQICRDLGAKGSIAEALLSLGGNSEDQNEFGVAQARYLEALAIYSDLGAKFGVAESLFHLANAAQGLTNHSEARALYAQCLAIFRTLRLTHGSVSSIEGVARVLASQSLTREAAILFGAAQVVREKTTMPPRPPIAQSKIQESLGAARSILGAEAFDTAWNEGLALSLDEAIDIALGGGE